MNAEVPSVSVLMITYNHEPFIAEAIESVLRQETTFPVHLVIGDDHSRDSTSAIAASYAARYPDRIAHYANETNLGMNRNWARAYQLCGGKYVALLEGDDYWPHPGKLQKQVDFMESHTDAVLCFHDAVSLLPDGTTAEYVPKSIFPRRPFYTDADFVRFNLFPTCSALFRNKVVTELPAEFCSDGISGDWFLYVMLSQHGPIHFLEEQLGVRRVHRGGFWSGKSRPEQYAFRIRSIEAVNALVGGKYESIAEEEVERLHEELANSMHRT